MDWISGRFFFLKIRFIDRNECTVNVPTNGDGSHRSELSLSTGRCFRVALLFRDTLEIKFTRNSAYFVPGARVWNRNERVLYEQLTLMDGETELFSA